MSRTQKTTTPDQEDDSKNSSLFDTFGASLPRPIRVYRPHGNKAAWRVVYYDGERRRELTTNTQERAVDMARELKDRLEANSLANEDKPIEFLIGTFLRTKGTRWSARTRAAHVAAAEELPDWFRRMRCGDWMVEHSEQVLDEISRRPRKDVRKDEREGDQARAHTEAEPGLGPVNFPLGTTTYRNVGALLRGMVTVGEARGCLPTGRPHPMKNVPYQRYAAPRPVEVTPDGKRNPFAAHIPLDDAFVITPDMLEAAAQEAIKVTGREEEGLRLRFLKGSGLRWGEHIALTFEDLNLDLARPSVKVTKQHYQFTNPETHKLVTARGAHPKWMRTRVALLDPALVPALDRHKQRARKRLADTGLTGDELDAALDKALVFPAAQGGICWPNNYNRRIWSVIAERLGWPKVEDLAAHERPVGMTKKSGWVVTPHSLRHAYVTWLLSDVGVPASLVAQYAGHKDSGFTEQVYGRRTSTAIDSGMEYVLAAGERHSQASAAASKPAGVGGSGAAVDLAAVGLTAAERRKVRPGGSRTPSRKPTVPGVQRKPLRRYSGKPRRVK